MDPVDLHLGRKLRRRRKLLGLTQQELAAACGVRFQQIQKYECAANRMSAARLWRLAEALNTPVDHFYEGLTSAQRGSQEDAEHLDLFTRAETHELVRAYYALAERPRRRLLALAKAMGGEVEA